MVDVAGALLVAATAAVAATVDVAAVAAGIVAVAGVAVDAAVDVEVAVAAVTAGALPVVSVAALAVALLEGRRESLISTLVAIRTWPFFVGQPQQLPQQVLVVEDLFDIESRG